MKKNNSPTISDEQSQDSNFVYDVEGVVKILWVFPPLRRWYIRWVNRVLPRVKTITLNRHRVFVFPSLHGFLFIMSAFCVFLAGTNYSNNLILALSFLLFGIFIVSIWQSFSNFLGLSIAAGGAEPIFLGETAHFKVSLTTPANKSFYAINLFWPKSSNTLFNIESETQKTVEVQIKPNRRGYFSPPRLSIETRFPLGSVRCWSHVALDTHCVVYPKPIKNDVYLGTAHEGMLGDEINHQGNEEFYQLQNYQDGENLSRVDWKSYSKGQGLMTKHFVSYQDRAIFLDYENFGDYAHELKLSYLCYWVLKFNEQNKPFGLVLPGVEIPVNHGKAHLNTCLFSLATFDMSASSMSALAMNHNGQHKAESKNSRGGKA